MKWNPTWPKCFKCSTIITTLSQGFRQSGTWRIKSFLLEIHFFSCFLFLHLNIYLYKNTEEELSCAVSETGAQLISFVESWRNLSPKHENKNFIKSKPHKLLATVTFSVKSFFPLQQRCQKSTCHNYKDILPAHWRLLLLLRRKKWKQHLEMCESSQRIRCVKVKFVIIREQTFLLLIFYPFTSQAELFPLLWPNLPPPSFSSTCGVLQGSFLGPLLFSAYTLPL